MIKIFKYQFPIPALARNYKTISRMWYHIPSAVVLPSVNGVYSEINWTRIFLRALFCTLTHFHTILSFNQNRTYGNWWSKQCSGYKNKNSSRAVLSFFKLGFNPKEREFSSMHPFCSWKEKVLGNWNRIFSEKNHLFNVAWNQKSISLQGLVV